jgi:hypothetical protein
VVTISLTASPVSGRGDRREPVTCAHMAKADSVG